MMTTDKSVQMTKCYGPWDGIGILSVIQIGLSSDFRFKFLSRDVHITDSKNKIPRKCSHFIFINDQRVYFIGVIWAGIDDNNFTFVSTIICHAATKFTRAFNNPGSVSILCLAQEG